MSEEIIKKINDVVAHYFKENTNTDWIPAKAIMPALIEAGVFNKDEKKGLPLRKVLRALDKANALVKIPTVHVERRTENVYWYLVREGKAYAPKEQISAVSKKEQGKQNIINSDEYYLVNLCDELLGQEASRKHTFDTLVGRLHKKGKGRTKLPLDAYYEDLKLVLEFFRKQTSEDESERDAQRKFYDQRKKEVLEKKKIRLIEINYALFECDASGAIIRDKANDVAVLKKILSDFV